MKRRLTPGQPAGQPEEIACFPGFGGEHINFFVRLTGRLWWGQPDPRQSKQFMFTCLFLFLRLRGWSDNQIFRWCSSVWCGLGIIQPNGRWKATWQRQRQCSQLRHWQIGRNKPQQTAVMRWQFLHVFLLVHRSYLNPLRVSPTAPSSLATSSWQHLQLSLSHAKNHLQSRHLQSL